MRAIGRAAMPPTNDNARRIPVAGPSISELEERYVLEAVRTAWYDNAGAFNARFEAAFAAYHRVKHAISLPSCTSGIHLALAAAGIGPGDEVVVPEATWIASAAPISYLGATPRFVDIDPGTWCLTADTVRAALGPRTRAIIAVDLYGSMPDLVAIRALAEERGLFLLEDAAEALGSTLNGRAAGTFGHAGVFSFHGSKTMTTGEGGMLVTDDDTLAARVRKLQDHGRNPGDTRFLNDEVAYKYKMSALQAALGLAQIERIGELVAEKRRIFSWYRDRLAGIAGLALNTEPAGVVNSYWMVTAVLPARPGLDKHEVIERLARLGIASRPFFSPLSSIPAYRGTPAAEEARSRNPVAYDICARGINLPSALCLVESDVDHVCIGLKNATGL
jgi:perosamine synthetase